MKKIVEHKSNRTAYQSPGFDIKWDGFKMDFNLIKHSSEFIAKKHKKFLNIEEVKSLATFFSNCVIVHHEQVKRKSSCNNYRIL